ARELRSPEGGSGGSEKPAGKGRHLDETQLEPRLPSFTSGEAEINRRKWKTLQDIQDLIATGSNSGRFGAEKSLSPEARAQFQAHMEYFKSEKGYRFLKERVTALEARGFEGEQSKIDRMKQFLSIHFQR
ncbi:MAG: hypothetical protein NUV67_04505, partial [archaeon]|nr:hypothetical protein [archaeon]